MPKPERKDEVIKNDGERRSKPAVIDDLEQYQKRMQLLAGYKAELATGPIVADTVRGSMSEAPYLERRITIRGVDVVRAEWLRLRIDILEKQCQRAEAFVASVADEHMQALLHWHYLQGLSWPKVQETLKIRYVTTDALKKKVQRFLSRGASCSDCLV